MTMSMSMMGFAGKPGTDVLPTCSIEIYFGGGEEGEEEEERMDESLDFRERKSARQVGV